MSEIERLVGEAIARGTALSLTVEELSPKRVLDILAEVGSSYRIKIRGPIGTVTVEVGNGLVVGAKAKIGHRRSSGKSAYAAIRRISVGEMQLEPLRFPSLANILQPVAELVDLAAPRGPELAGDDTIEIALPQARPHHTPDPATVETDIELEEEPVTVIDSNASQPMPILQLTLATRQQPLPKPRRRKAILIGAAAALVLGVIGTGWMMADSEPSAQLDPIAPLTASPISVSTHLTVDMDFGDIEPEIVSTGQNTVATEARQLARAARARLRAGDAPGALAAARHAARIRGGRPFYQVLLGDALRANGRRAAANRAYRRAVRLRPGYRPAVRRLERRRAGTTRSVSSSQT